MPGGLRWLSNFVWARYYIEIVRDAFLQGGGWPAVWYKVAARSAASAALFFIAGVAPDAADAARGVSHASVARSARLASRCGRCRQKELNQIKRDRRIIMSLVLPPILQLMLFGTVMSPDVGQHPARHRRRQPLARRAAISIAALSESGSFSLRGGYDSVEAARATTSATACIDAGVVDPADFARDLLRGRATTVQVLLNAMNANTAAISQGYVPGVIQGFNRQPATDAVAGRGPTGAGSLAGAGLRAAPADVPLQPGRRQLPGSSSPACSARC